MTSTNLFLDPDTCPLCGFRPRTVLPNDAVRAARSLPRRWREILTAFGAEEDAEHLVRRPLGAGPSALAHAALVTDALHRAAASLDKLWTQEHPALDDGPRPDAATTGEGRKVESVLAELTDAAARLADQAQRFHGSDWLRTGTRTGREETALQVLRRAVHEGTHRLREASRGLTRLRAEELAGPPARSGTLRSAA